MVTSDGQEITDMIINHLLRSACAVDLKSSVDTCGKPTGFPWPTDSRVSTHTTASRYTQRYHAVFDI